MLILRGSLVRRGEMGRAQAVVNSGAKYAQARGLQAAVHVHGLPARFQNTELSQPFLSTTLHYTTLDRSVTSVSKTNGKKERRNLYNTDGRSHSIPKATISHKNCVALSSSLLYDNHTSLELDHHLRLLLLLRRLDPQERIRIAIGYKTDHTTFHKSSEVLRKK